MPHHRGRASPPPTSIPLGQMVLHAPRRTHSSGRQGRNEKEKVAAQTHQWCSFCDRYSKPCQYFIFLSPRFYSTVSSLALPNGTATKVEQRQNKTFGRRYIAYTTVFAPAPPIYMVITSPCTSCDPLPATSERCRLAMM